MNTISYIIWIVICPHSEDHDITTLRHHGPDPNRGTNVPGTDFCIPYPVLTFVYRTRVQRTSTGLTENYSTKYSRLEYSYTRYPVPGTRYTKSLCTFHINMQGIPTRRRGNQRCQPRLSTLASTLHTKHMGLHTKCMVCSSH